MMRSIDDYSDDDSSPPPPREKCLAIVYGILTASFNRSRTKVKDTSVLFSAAHKAVSSKRLAIGLEAEPSSTYAIDSGGALVPPYAWPSIDPREESRAAVLCEVLQDAFAQRGVKIRDKEAVLSAARHICQSGELKVRFPGEKNAQQAASGEDEPVSPKGLQLNFRLD